MPFRGKRNEPAYVKHVLSAVSNTLAMNEQKLAAITVENGQRAFNLATI